MELNLQIQSELISESSFNPSLLLDSQALADISEDAFVCAQVSLCLLPLQLSPEKHEHLTRLIADGVAQDEKLRLSLLMLGEAYATIS